MRSRSPAARMHYDGTSRDDESNQRQQDRVRLTESQPLPVPPRYIPTGLRDAVPSHPDVLHTAQKDARSATTQWSLPCGCGPAQETNNGEVNSMTDRSCAIYARTSIKSEESGSLTR